jgi:hypothetical protein
VQGLFALYDVIEEPESWREIINDLTVNTESDETINSEVTQRVINGLTSIQHLQLRQKAALSDEQAGTGSPDRVRTFISLLNKFA